MAWTSPPADSPSTDGVIIDSSQNITVHGCGFRSVVHAAQGIKGLAAGGQDSPPVSIST
jgi:hypothetical protein